MMKCMPVVLYDATLNSVHGESCNSSRWKQVERKTALNARAYTAILANYAAPLQFVKNLFTPYKY